MLLLVRFMWFLSRLGCRGGPVVIYFVLPVLRDVSFLDGCNVYFVSPHVIANVSLHLFSLRRGRIEDGYFQGAKFMFHLEGGALCHIVVF